MRLLIVAICVTATALALDYRTPAGERTAAVRPGAESILPGGRLISPIGQHFRTGPGPFGLAINRKGDLVVTADGGPSRYSLTVLRRRGGQWHSQRVETLSRAEAASKDRDAWRSVFMGLAFATENELWVSEGNSGRVRRVNAISGKTRAVVDLNQGGFADSYTGDLALDPERNLLYVVDQANFRMVVIDAKSARVLSSIRVGRLPFALALSPDYRRAYVANIGMFEYKAIPGVDPKELRETALPFPAFGFPSREAVEGARRRTERGEVDVPGLGDPNVAESNSVCAIDVSEPSSPRLLGHVRTGRPFGGGVHGGSSPSGVLATGDRVFVANGHNDTITVIDAASFTVLKEIPIRIPGLENYRGVLPIGMAYHAPSGWLLVAEAGINSVGVIDTRSGTVLGHIPTAWFPTRVALDGDTVWVSAAKGVGTGPNATRQKAFSRSFQGELRRGAILRFPLPKAEEIEEHTARVIQNNGFKPLKQEPHPIPPALKYVVMIIKENRTFDEVFGDIALASNGPVRGAPDLARFGRRGVIESTPGQLQQRPVLHDVHVAPNHREIAERWAFSDNFYADSEVSVDGHHWLVGSYPNAWTESTLMAAYGGQKNFRFPTTAPGRLLFAGSNSSVHPEEQLEAGALWHHLERHGITFRNFGEGFEVAGGSAGPGFMPTGGRYVTNMPISDPLYRNTSRQYPQYNTNIPDQYRANAFIAEMEALYGEGKEPFPRLIYIHLPNDHMDKPRPEDGYPYSASYVADNDYALGRILEYLSKTPYWKEMAVFITEDDAQGGVDHIDSHRTIMMVAGPYAKKNYVSRVNTSFPGLLKTVFRILGIPPLNLYDAAATDLSDCFTNTPDFTRYEVKPVDGRIFDPAKAKDPKDPKPRPPMDDPATLMEQHQRK